MQYFIIRNEENKATGEIVRTFSDLEHAQIMAQLLTSEIETVREYPGGDVTVISEDGDKIASYYIAKQKSAPVKKESEKINFEVLGFHKRNEWSDRYWGR